MSAAVPDPSDYQYPPIKVGKVTKGIEVPHPRWDDALTNKGAKGARITCWFGHVMHLADYVIQSNGEVHPGPVKCSEKGCSFVGRLRLHGWKP